MKFTSVLVSIVALASMASPALANDKRQEKDFRPQIRANVRDSIASKSSEFKKEEVKNRITESRRKQLKEWWTRASKRLTSITTRLNKIVAKISARLDKLTANGKDVTAQRAELAAARIKIDVAIQSIASGSSQIDSILANNTPTDAFRKLHDLQFSIIAKIRDAHKSLVTLLASLHNVAN